MRERRASPHRPSSMRRLGKVLLLMLGLVLLLIGYGVAVEPRLIDERDITATVPELPAGWEGKEVAFISDQQLGILFANEGTSREMVDRIVADDPAVALLGGDFVYAYPYGGTPLDEQIATIVDIVEPLVMAGIPTYAVLGNHDYLSGVADELTRSLEAAGVRVLANEAVALPEPAGAAAQPPLYLVGIAPLLPGQAAPSEALAAVPDAAPRIVLMHNPNAFDRFPPRTAPFAIAGHTHGGQIRVPFTPQWSVLALLSEEKISADGWIEDFGAPGNQLFVSKGIGMSVVPMRLACLPELTSVTLRRG